MKEYNKGVLNNIQGLLEVIKCIASLPLPSRAEKLICISAKA